MLCLRFVSCLLFAHCCVWFSHGKAAKGINSQQQQQQRFFIYLFILSFFAVTLLLTHRDTVCTLRRLRFKMVSSKDHGVIRTLWVMQRLAPLKA